ncbi:hypothetical protein G6F64_014083 [Rhizopus arrhizus]|uniref:Uncharacterized protein n=1 Tax=Rhizopus oryzae TaxID=64495 RepID=A0A9P6WUS0_RHIOR|nr:hypothetical protein G6F64_014083 [Rhizopus arrhizus]
MTYIAGDRPDDLEFKDNAALRERVLAYMNEAVRREFSEAGYQLLNAPAPHALRIRAAITGTPPRPPATAMIGAAAHRGFGARRQPERVADRGAGHRHRQQSSAGPQAHGRRRAHGDRRLGAPGAPAVRPQLAGRNTLNGKARRAATPDPR